MLGDINLIFADSLVLPNGGATPGGLMNISGTSDSAFTVDMEQAGNPLADGIDILDDSNMEMSVHVNTATGGSDARTVVEVQIVSLPIDPSLLDHATPGKELFKAAVVTDSTANDFTLTGHDLPLGTPFYLTSLATTTGVADNTQYYAIPRGANEFAAATSLDNAIAGTEVAMGTGNGTATVNFQPRVHLTTGPIRIDELQAGAIFTGRTVPGSITTNGKAVDALQHYDTPATAADVRPLGAGWHSGTGTGGGALGAAALGVSPAPGRYLACFVSITGAAEGGSAAITVRLGTPMGGSMVKGATGIEIIT